MKKILGILGLCGICILLGLSVKWSMAKNISLKSAFVKADLPQYML